MDNYSYDTYSGHQATSHNSQSFLPHHAAGHQAGMFLPNGQLVLVGLQAISKAVGAGPGTIKKWIKEEEFPVRRCSDGIYRASPESVKAWFENMPHGNA